MRETRRCWQWILVIETTELIICCVHTHSQTATPHTSDRVIRCFDCTYTDTSY